MKIMNKILKEEMEYLIHCNDKAITPDVKDDVKMTLDYIDELENKINEAIEYIKQYEEIYYPDEPLSEPVITYNIGIYEEDFDEAKLLDILRGEDNENYKTTYN